MQHLDQLFLEFRETEIIHLIIFVCDYFIMILYSLIFIQEKEGEKSDQALVASATTGEIGQAEAVCVFYYTPLSQITDT